MTDTSTTRRSSGPSRRWPVRLNASFVHRKTWWHCAARTDDARHMLELRQARLGLAAENPVRTGPPRLSILRTAPCGGAAMLDASLATSADYRDRFDEVIRRVIYDLPSIAKVHSISLFVNRVEHTFAHWLIDETKNSLKGRRQAEVIKFFDRADAAASSIFGILESIREDTLEAAWSQQRAEDLDINILEFHLKVRKLLEQLGAPDVDSLQAIMGAFALVAKRYKQQVIE